MTRPKLLIRTDASPTSGLGHLMRCRALACEWIARGGEATFVTTGTPPGLLDWIRREGCAIRIGPSDRSHREEPNWLVPLLQEEKPAVLVLDGYDFDLEYQQVVKPWINCLVCLDDVPGRRVACDVLLNQNLGVTAEEYEPLIPHGTTLLLGPRYALLRPEVKEHAGSYRQSAKPRRVLVTLGGADPADHTARVLKELAGTPDLELDVVLGALYPHADPKDRLAGIAPERVRVHRGPDGLLELARQADLAVTAGGSTVWELACLGIPMVVIGTAANQKAVLRGLKAEQAALVVGWIESMESGTIGRAVQSLLAAPSRLEELSKAAIRLVDGKGVERVVEVIEAICSQPWPRVGVLAGPEKA